MTRNTHALVQDTHHLDHVNPQPVNNHMLADKVQTMVRRDVGA